ncbi:cytochrome P450 monooxygenase-like protein [Colletotrichum phormii]|uniref:Cytochrome P450 monooxygenase-like protein n=1 Tax=Colletotrichum phormii TaxID=359342 RepID=A0AAI9ZFM8_9PEZI|nr:cytochrome P450 monooxygenase-like protein [Colletotrichum phormii]KAK1622509.1 cytochrome P450 monooxygenase-like protein [Colletotrichum phormii]
MRGMLYNEYQAAVRVGLGIRCTSGQMIETNEVVRILIFYNLYLHSLSKYHGPWYAASFSLCSAVISVVGLEPHWMLYLAKRYGYEKPIRIAPSLLLFPQSKAIKNIYWDSKCNNKAPLYGSSALGPPHLFSTIDGGVHKSLRKALGGPSWSVGGLKNNWEPRINNHIQLFVQRMTEFADKNQPVILSDKVAEFAADIMTLVCFTNPWGFVDNSRDERNMLKSWREGLVFFGFAGRFRFFRDVILKGSLSKYFLPGTSDDNGMGYLMRQADREVSGREQRMSQEDFPKKDQISCNCWCLEARMDGQPLTAMQKRAHVTLLIQAGADTTGTALDSTLRFILTHAPVFARVRAELKAASDARLLSTPIQFEETRAQLPYFIACIKESLRLHPPATNLFGQVAPSPDGKVVDGTWIPAGAEITSNAYVVQRDPHLYAPDPEAYRPERWLEDEGNLKEHISEMDASAFVFGVGPRVCLGKDVAVMEMYKLLPEVVRQFDFHIKEEGKFVVVGGIAYNERFVVQLRRRKE